MEKFFIPEEDAQFYAIYKIADDTEILLNEDDCPGALVIDHSQRNPNSDPLHFVFSDMPAWCDNASKTRELSAKWTGLVSDR